MLGRTACSAVFPHTRLNLDVDILTEPLGVMDRMNLLCLEKDMLTLRASRDGKMQDSSLDEHSKLRQQ